jgi:hypothetical protein
MPSMDFWDFAKSAAGLITAIGSLLAGAAALLTALAKIYAARKRARKSAVEPPRAEHQRPHAEPSARTTTRLGPSVFLVGAIVLVVVGGAILGSRFVQGPAPAPTIKIVQVPAAGGSPDSTASISGRVHGLRNPHEFRVVVYARTDHWYVQPSEDSPLTPIQPDGSWSTSTRPGVRYAALLVRSAYRPPRTAEALPVGSDDVLAVDVRMAAQ